MKYDDLYKEFTAVFPEDAEFFNSKKQETMADEDDGIHVMFSMVVTPFVVKCLNDKLEEKSEKIFKFIEEMETSEDKMISEVAEISVLEELITSNKDLMDAVKALAGPETLQAIDEIKKWYR